jgi:hypothetical protein
MTKIRLFILFTTFLVLVLIGGIAIYYARGYRIGIKENNITVSAQGLLVVNSDPTGAQVFVDNVLKTATNNTVSLIPGTYTITVKKEGYHLWEKTLSIEKETVTQVDAFLLPSAPSLTALTFSGVFNPTLSDDFSKIAYGVPVTEEDGAKAGLWILETMNLPLGFNRDPRQITNGDIKDATWEWSPDSREILLSTKLGTYLLDTSKFTPQFERVAITPLRLTEIKEEWKDKTVKRLDSQLSRLPDELESVFTKNAANIHFSPDENRILYTASGSATLSEDIVKPLPGASTQQEERQLKDKKSYVYDIKEDKNFAVGEPGQNLSWLPNSLNLIYPEQDKITVLDYDGTNRKMIFSGNYTYPHAYPSTSSNRILILTNLGAQTALPNLYWLSLK